MRTLIHNQRRKCIINIMARWSSSINNFCVVFGAGIFLCAVVITLSSATEVIFHRSNSMIGWMIAFVYGGRMLAKLSQSKRNRAITLMLAVIGYSALFGVVGVISWGILMP